MWLQEKLILGGTKNCILLIQKNSFFLALVIKPFFFYKSFFIWPQDFMVQSASARVTILVLSAVTLVLPTKWLWHVLSPIPHLWVNFGQVLDIRYVKQNFNL